MYPVIVKLGPLTIYSFGLMMAIAFLTANYLFTGELRRRKLDERIATQITMICLIGGVGGAKLFSVLENWKDFVDQPMQQLFSPAGLTFYGGFIVAALWIYVYLKRKKIGFLLFADMIAPTVLLAYGIGRIGCQLAGDGDYGIPSKLPWAMSYPQGTAKPSSALAEYFQKEPSQESVWHYDSLRHVPVGTDRMGSTITAFDETVTVHPAPLYETIAAILGFYFIWKQRAKRERQFGAVYSMTLIVMGAERLLVEFIRINPLYVGLSMAQWISVAMIALGAYTLAAGWPKRSQALAESTLAIKGPMIG